MKKKVVAVIVSVTILAVIYTTIDEDRLVATLHSADGRWLVMGLSLFIPLTLLSALRLRQLAALSCPSSSLSLYEASSLVLSANAMNIVLPSKGGDIAKGYFLRGDGQRREALIAVVAYEKAIDLFALFVWTIPGAVAAFFLASLPLWFRILFMPSLLAGTSLLGALLLSPRVATTSFTALESALVSVVRTARRFSSLGRRLMPSSDRVQDSLTAFGAGWEQMQALVRSHRGIMVKVALLSLFLWLLHLLQIWTFVACFGVLMPFFVHATLAAASICVGLLPFTMAGVGTRDAALIVFYAPYLNAATAAAVGLLCSLRYFVPAIAGLPFLSRHLAQLRTAKSPNA